MLRVCNVERGTFNALQMYAIITNYKLLQFVYAYQVTNYLISDQL